MISRALAWCAVVGVAALGGCAERGKTSDGSEAPATDSYTVRGLVKSLPGVTSDFSVQHEAIPEFRTSEGGLGMDVMTMPFWPPSGISESEIEPERIAGFSLDGIDVGDKVAVTFEVRYHMYADTNMYELVGYYATRVEELDPATELDFTPLPKSDGG